MQSLVYHANTRVSNPMYGCVGAISALQQQVTNLHNELAMAQAELVTPSMQQVTTSMEATHDDNRSCVNYNQYQQLSQEWIG